MQRIQNPDPEFRGKSHPTHVLRQGDESFFAKVDMPAYPDAPSLKSGELWTRYLEAARLRRTFWKDLGLEVFEPPIRSSGINTLLECPRKFLWRERLALHLKGEYSDALELGKSFHLLMEDFYSGVAPENLEQRAVAKAAEAVKKLVEEANPANGLMPSGESVAALTESLVKEAKAAAAMMYVMGKVYPLEKTLRAYDVVWVEQAFEIRVPGLPPIVFKPDVVLRKRDDGVYWIVDHKTTSVSPVERAGTLPMEYQPRLYAWALWIFLNQGKHDLTTGLEKVGGVVHNIVRKPSIRVKKNESFDDYLGRVRQWYEDVALESPDDPPILQSTCMCQPYVLEEDLLSVLHMTAMASRCSLNLSRFYPVTRSCFGPFGNHACPYLPLCRRSGHPKNWFTHLRDDYVQRPREEEGTVLKGTLEDARPDGLANLRDLKKMVKE